MNLNRDPEQAVLLTKKEKVTYTLNLNQVQLDILHELCSLVGGTGTGRTFTNSLCDALETHSSIKNDYFDTTYFDSNSMVRTKEYK